MARFNHLYSVAFSVYSEKEDASDVTPAMLREALLTRIADLNRSVEAVEWLEACENLGDTCEEGE
jgi:hypothetical protein